MGILDFFKKIFAEEELEIKPELIKISDLENWIQDNKKEIWEKDKLFLKQTKKIIDNLSEEIEEKMLGWEDISMEKVKSEERVKFIVKENFLTYLDYVKKLREDLEKLDKNNSKKLISNIHSLFTTFEKKSSVNFQKASIFIGKELEEIKSCIGNFIKEIKNLTNKNKYFLEKVNTLNSIEAKLTEKNKVENLKLNIKKNIQRNKIQIEKSGEEISMLNEKIEQIKKTEGYIEKIKKKQEIEKLRENFNEEIYNLKERINFKELANFFHITQKDMEIVNAHKEKFKENFEKDSGKSLLNLINEAKLSNESITTKIDEILKIKKSINEFISEKDVLEDFYNNIKTKEREIENLNIQQIKEDKKFKRFDSTIEEIFKFIKEDLGKINVEVN
ncbi:MAG: hypothetical protein U9Q06_00680 [Nanoarchaeota archaeon]|nr:hypothetical protein [Nanoarchaeota archaeon]